MITTLYGENDVLRQAALKRLVDDFVAQYDDMGLERLDGEEASYERMHEAVQSLPFLAARKLVILRRPGASKEFAEKFEQFAGDVAETNDVVLVEPKLDKRSGYYKQVQKLTDFREYKILDANGIARFAAEYAKQQGGTLSPADARLLVERVGAEQLLVQHEVDKLLAYDPKISRDSIELLTERTPQSTVFELLDAAFNGNIERALKLYDEQRALQVEPQQVLAMLVWQIYSLALTKAAGNKPAAAIAKDAGMSPFAVEKSQRLSRKIPGPRLKAMVRELREFDVRLKSESIDADEVIRYYLISLAQ